MARQPSMAASWKTLTRHPLSAEYADIKGRAFDKLVSDLKECGIVGGRSVIVHEGMVIDGWQLYRACLAADVEPTFTTLALTGLTPEKWVEIANDRRRHETPAQQKKRAEARCKRVAKAREQGQSIRSIAEAEGVSNVQVRRDLTKDIRLGVPGGAPERVTGADGKSYPSKKTQSVDSVGDAPICPRCKRVGQLKDCAICAALQAKHERETLLGQPTHPLRDAEGHIVNGPSEAFTNLSKFEALDTLCRQLQKGIDELARLPGGEQLRPFTKAIGTEGKTILKMEELDTIKRHLKLTRPHSVCPECSGSGTKGCKGCSGRGWVSSMTWKDMDDKVKAKLKVLA